MAMDSGGTGSGDKPLTDKAKEGGQQAVQQAQETATQVAGQAQEKAKSALDNQMDRGTQMMSSAATALRQAGEGVQGEQAAPVGTLLTRGADQLERVGGYLQERDSTQLIQELESYGRKSPAVLLGVAFGLGLLASRFLKSRSDAGGSQYGYGSGFGSRGSYDREYGMRRSPYRYENAGGSSYTTSNYGSDYPEVLSETEGRGTGYETHLETTDGTSTRSR